MLYDSVFDYVHIKYNCVTKKIYYEVHTPYSFYSERYNHWVTCHTGMVSDGATGALDINSFAWLIHDRLCDTGRWDDGTHLTNWQASSVCADVLSRDGFYIRAITWKYTTFAIGGGKARTNGMFML